MSELAERLREQAETVARLFGSVDPPEDHMRPADLLWFTAQDAADRLSEYAALGSKLPTVPCPTCGGNWCNYREPGSDPNAEATVCPNPDCDGGTVRLTLEDAVAITAAVFTDEWWSKHAWNQRRIDETVADLRNVRATNFGNETINNKGERNGT